MRQSTEEFCFWKFERQRRIHQGKSADIYQMQLSWSSVAITGSKTPGSAGRRRGGRRRRELHSGTCAPLRSYLHSRLKERKRPACCYLTSTRTFTRFLCSPRSPRPRMHAAALSSLSSDFIKRSASAPRQPPGARKGGGEIVSDCHKYSKGANHLFSSYSYGVFIIPF